MAKSFNYEDLLTRLQISAVSAVTKNAIKRKTAFNLPDRPSDKGMKPAEIKAAFWSPVIDAENSAISEIDRVIADINAAFKNAYDYVENRSITAVDYDEENKTVNWIFGRGDNEQVLDLKLDDIFLTPIVDGEGVGSAVQEIKDEWGLTKNRALAILSRSVGAGNVAGSYAFRLMGYDAKTKTYTLDSTEGLTVGDYYSIYFRYRRTKFGQITAISDNTITVDNHFLPGVSDEEKELYLPEAYIYIVGKPELGTIVIGSTASASGIDTIAAEGESDAGGRNNISDGRYGFTRGYGNTTGYCGATFGQDNENLGLKGFIGGGQGNYIGPNVERGAAFNKYNKVLANDGFAAGIGNIVDRIAQAKFGKYSSPTNALLAVGIGTSDTDRLNAFTVFPEGFAEVYEVYGNKDLSVTNVKYVRNNYLPRLRPTDSAKTKRLYAYNPNDQKDVLLTLTMDPANGTVVSRDDYGGIRAVKADATDYAGNTIDGVWKKLQPYHAAPKGYVDNNFVPLIGKTSSGYSAYVLYGDGKNKDENGNPVQTPQLKTISSQGTGGALAQYGGNGRLADKNTSSWTFDSYADAELPNKRVISGYLNDSTSGYLKKVKDEVAAGINEFATAVSNDSVVNSYKELIDYVATHGGEAAEMAAAIQTNKSNITTNAQNIAASATVIATNKGNIATLTDDISGIQSWMEGIVDGKTAVGQAKEAESAVKATKDSKGNVIHETYATIDALEKLTNETVVSTGTYPEMSVGTATYDSAGNDIANPTKITYKPYSGDSSDLINPYVVGAYKSSSGYANMYFNKLGVHALSGDAVGISASGGYTAMQISKSGSIVVPYWNIETNTVSATYDVAEMLNEYELWTINKEPTYALQTGTYLNMKVGKIRHITNNLAKLFDIDYFTPGTTVSGTFTEDEVNTYFSQRALVYVSVTLWSSATASYYHQYGGMVQANHMMHEQGEEGTVDALSVNDRNNYTNISIRGDGYMSVHISENTSYDRASICTFILTASDQ